VGRGDRRAASQARLMRLVVHPAAQRELDLALDWYRERAGVVVARRLLRRYVRAGELLKRHPAIGTPALAEARKMPLMQFPYTLVYRIDGAVIQVIALAHQSREPDYWVGRQ
jgi:toxin ParE1/3/4